MFAIKKKYSIDNDKNTNNNNTNNEFSTVSSNGNEISIKISRQSSGCHIHGNGSVNDGSSVCGHSESCTDDGSGNGNNNNNNNKMNLSCVTCNEKLRKEQKLRLKQMLNRQMQEDASPSIVNESKYYHTKQGIYDPYGQRLSISNISQSNELVNGYSVNRDLYGNNKREQLQTQLQWQKQLNVYRPRPSINNNNNNNFDNSIDNSGIIDQFNIIQSASINIDSNNGSQHNGSQHNVYSNINYSSQHNSQIYMDCRKRDSYSISGNNNGNHNNNNNNNNNNNGNNLPKLVNFPSYNSIHSANSGHSGTGDNIMVEMPPIALTAQDSYDRFQMNNNNMNNNNHNIGHHSKMYSNNMEIINSIINVISSNEKDIGYNNNVENENYSNKNDKNENWDNNIINNNNNNMPGSVNVMRGIKSVKSDKTSEQIEGRVIIKQEIDDDAKWAGNKIEKNKNEIQKLQIRTRGGAPRRLRPDDKDIDASVSHSNHSARHSNQNQNNQNNKNSNNNINRNGNKFDVSNFEVIKPSSVLIISPSMDESSTSENAYQGHLEPPFSYNNNSSVENSVQIKGRNSIVTVIARDEISRSHNQKDDICLDEIGVIFEKIGTIRRAIVRAKRVTRHIRDRNKQEKHLQNVDYILSIINKNNIDANDQAIIIELFEAIKTSNEDNLGRDLLDTLTTMNLNINYNNNGNSGDNDNNDNNVGNENGDDDANTYVD